MFVLDAKERSYKEGPLDSTSGPRTLQLIDEGKLVEDLPGVTNDSGDTLLVQLALSESVVGFDFFWTNPQMHRDFRILGDLIFLRPGGTIEDRQRSILDAVLVSKFLQLTFSFVGIIGQKHDERDHLLVFVLTNFFVYLLDQTGQVVVE